MKEYTESRQFEWETLVTYQEHAKRDFTEAKASLDAFCNKLVDLEWYADNNPFGLFRASWRNELREVIDQLREKLHEVDDLIASLDRTIEEMTGTEDEPF